MTKAKAAKIKVLENVTEVVDPVYGWRAYKAPANATLSAPEGWVVEFEGEVIASGIDSKERACGIAMDHYHAIGR